MSHEIIPITTDNLDKACKFLHGVVPNIAPEDWKKSVVPHWPWDGESLGLMLIVNGVVSGILFNQQCIRTYGEKPVKGCNITSWFVSPELRGKGLGGQLIQQALADTDAVYTIQCPDPTTVNTYLRVGFHSIDVTEWIIVNLPRWSLNGFSESQDFNGLLTGPALENYKAHADNSNVGHVGVLGPDGRFCHIIFVRCQWRKLPGARIVYASDYEMLESALPTFSQVVLKRHKLPLTAIEKRRCANRPSMAIAEREREPILYRGNDIQADQIDSIFCEIVTFPHSVR